MSSDDSNDETPSDDERMRFLGAALDGLRDDGAATKALFNAIRANDAVAVTREGAKFLRKLITTEIPDEPDDISELGRGELTFAIYRVSAFEKIRYPVASDDQLEALYERTIDEWGEYPTEPVGRWAEWVLWVTLDRRRNATSPTELLTGEKDVEDVVDTWGRRHHRRTDRRRRQKVHDYDRYDDIKDVPAGLKEIVLQPVFGQYRPEASERPFTDIPFQDPATDDITPSESSE